MKEVEEQILQKKDELLSAVRKDKKDDRLERAVNLASALNSPEDSSEKNIDDVMVDADDDFEEFSPTE